MTQLTPGLSPQTPVENGAQARHGEAEGSGAWRELKVGDDIPEGRSIDLRDLGFVGGVSDEARAEIRANERRAARVLSTAHLYWFGRHG